MDKIRKSDFLKIVCYIAIPILVLVAIAGIVYTRNFTYYNDELNKKDYYSTDSFAYGEYCSNIYSLINRLNIIDKQDRYNKEERINNAGYILARDDTNKIYYDKYNSTAYIEYIVINNNGEIYTNVHTDNYNDKIDELKNSKYNWYKENKRINSSLEQITQDGLNYKYGIEENEEILQSNYDIYMRLNTDKIEDDYNIVANKNMYDMLVQLREFPIIIMIISLIVLGIIAVYLIWSIGYKKGENKVVLGLFDKYPYEIIFLILVGTIILCVTLMLEGFSNNIIYALIIFLTMYFIGYIACAILGITTIKRIKTGMLIKTTLLYKICKYIKKILNNISDMFICNKKVSTQILFYYIGFLIINCILVLTLIATRNLLFGLLIVTVWVYAGYKILNYVQQINDVKESLKSIYEGKKAHQLNKENYEIGLKEMIIYIENISLGLTKAVEKSLKSERMKTELITNVSHDIKTPLTSIINYVDLLKKEEIPNEKAQEYLEILDQKSQRLKRLTEDLVEASKASSGNIKLNIEKLNVKELINQISGEYEDKFKQNGLELILKIPQEEVIINADSRYMYRVLENMYANIVKYALKGSRVYVDILKNNDKTRIELKNISREKLNISSEELMQRFVRGESSRNTEGSGLGLSIAESLTKLQGGTFTIHLDGDLFKVIIEF